MCNVLCKHDTKMHINQILLYVFVEALESLSMFMQLGLIPNSISLPIIDLLPLFTPIKHLVFTFLSYTMLTQFVSHLLRRWQNYKQGVQFKCYPLQIWDDPFNWIILKANTSHNGKSILIGISSITYSWICIKTNISC